MSQQPSQRSVPTPSASQTTTIASTSQSTPGSDPAPSILRLRGQHSTNGRSVQWAEDVVDNEGLGRKSSKVCCIYHKPKAVDESSDESSSDSSSDSESDYEERMRRGGGRNGKGREKDGDHDEGCDHAHDHDDGKPRQNKDKRPPSPNAYEKVPKLKRKEEVTEKK